MLCPIVSAKESLTDVNSSMSSIFQLVPHLAPLRYNELEVIIPEDESKSYA